MKSGAFNLVFWLIVLIIEGLLLVNKTQTVQDFITTFCSQKFVDEKLTVLAKIFHAKATLEAKYFSIVTSQKEENKENIAFLEKIRYECAEAKRDFWVAHGLAKDLGFVVLTKYKDYLPKEEG